MARILIIEDDEEMRSLLKDLLSDEGYDADSARNGSEALLKLAKESFDLVITDIRMPGLTGFDILSVIKKLELGMPVIIITAFGGEEVYRCSMARGADGYLEKPIHFHKLRSMIYDLVSPKEKVEGDVSAGVAQQAPAAAQKPATSQAAATAVQKPAPAQTAPAKENWAKVRGVVENVNGAAKEVTVQTQQGKMMTFGMGDHSHITEVTTGMPLSALKKGMGVTVEYARQGNKLMAEWIDVHMGKSSANPMTLAQAKEAKKENPSAPQAQAKEVKKENPSGKTTENK